MNKNRIINLVFLLIAFTLPPLSIKAQRKKKDDPRAAYTSSRNALEPMPVHLSGMGSLKFYGVKIGVDYPFRMTEIRGFKGTATGQRVLREQYISADFGLWHYDGVHENAFFSTEWTLRFINGQGYFVQISPVGVGVNYTILPFFKVKSSPDSVPAIAKFYVTPSVSVGIGRDFAFRRANKGVPLTVFMKGGASAMFPYKKWGYIFPTAELGMAVRFRGFNAFVRKVRKD